MARDALLKGTLDLLVLRVTAEGEAHGYAISRRIRAASEEVLQVEEGSLYPALHRLEKQGLLRSRWAASENGRRARYYALTAKGRRRLAEDRAGWQRMSTAIGRVLGGGSSEEA